jgi:hypothetical protein
MEVTLQSPESPPPVNRAHVVSIVIKSFKGRRDVEIHLFRTGWDENEFDTIDWDRVLEPRPGEADPIELEKSRRFLLEAFTVEERDLLVGYLTSRYEDRLERITSMPLEFPLPEGITPLGEVPLGQDIGIVRFEKIPHYTLPFDVHGLFDLGRHKPMVEMAENR